MSGCKSYAATQSLITTSKPGGGGRRGHPWKKGFERLCLQKFSVVFFVFVFLFCFVCLFGWFFFFFLAFLLSHVEHIIVIKCWIYFPVEYWLNEIWPCFMTRLFHLPSNHLLKKIHFFPFKKCIFLEKDPSSCLLSCLRLILVQVSEIF